jgi:hypothetical protein
VREKFTEWEIEPLVPVTEIVLVAAAADEAAIS